MVSPNEQASGSTIWIYLCHITSRQTQFLPALAQCWANNGKRWITDDGWFTEDGLFGI